MKKIVNAVQVNAPFRMLCEQYLDLFVEHGLNPEIGLDADALDNYSRVEWKEIADRFLGLGRTITIHGPFLDLSAGSPDPAVREVTRHRLEQMLSAVEVFKPVAVVCHPGYDWQRYSYFEEEWLERSREFWFSIGKEVHRRGSRLMLENVYERGPQEMEPLLASLSAAGVGFCLDLGHQNVFGQVPLADWLGRMGSCLGQLHLHDNHGDRDAHLGMGQGNIDFSEMLSHLLKRGSSPVVITLEPHEAEPLWQSLAYLERYWGRLFDI